MNQNRRNFGQFCKYFTMRAVQIIVQSRLGGKISTECRGTTPNDWFNINVSNVPEINEQLAKSLKNHFLPELSEVNVLVSLRTADGETLHLEVWKLSIDSQQTVENLSSVQNQLYHRMSVLLRSILAASRATPAYKLYTRSQSAETYVLCYQIFASAADYRELLGDQHRSVDLGFVGCCLGSVKAALYYRTKMVIHEKSAHERQSIKNVDEQYYSNPSKSEKPHYQKISEHIKPQMTDAARNFGQRIEMGERLIAHCAQKIEDCDPAADCGRPLGAHPMEPAFGQPFAADLLPERPAPTPLKSFFDIAAAPSNFSPCFSNFSTSPGSFDFNAVSPLAARRPSGSSTVGFHLGATSGSSSEEGGSGSQQQLVHGPTNFIPFKPSNPAASVALAGTSIIRRPRRNVSSAGGVFFMEISEHSSSATSPLASTKASSSEDADVPCDRGRKEGRRVNVVEPLFGPKHRTFSVDSFPFARLLAASRSYPMLDATALTSFLKCDAVKRMEIKPTLNINVAVTSSLPTVVSSSLSVDAGVKVSSSSLPLSSASNVRVVASTPTVQAAPSSVSLSVNAEPSATSSVSTKVRVPSSFDAAPSTATFLSKSAAATTSLKDVRSTSSGVSSKSAAIDSTAAPSVGGNDDDEDSLTTSGGVKIFAAKRRSATVELSATTLRRRAAGDDGAWGRTDGLLISSSSSDDSFVHIEIRPAYVARIDAPSSSPLRSSGLTSTRFDGDVEDASDLLSQCKAAPSVLKSFVPMTFLASSMAATAKLSASAVTSSTTQTTVSEAPSKNTNTHAFSDAFDSQKVTTAAKSTSPLSDVDDILSTIPSQLKEFEEQAKTFDEFLSNVKVAAGDDNNSTGEEEES